MVGREALPPAVPADTWKYSSVPSAADVSGWPLDTRRSGLGADGPHRHRCAPSPGRACQPTCRARRSGAASERFSVPGFDTASASQSRASQPARSSPRQMAAPGSRCAEEACQVLGGSWRTGSLLAATAGRRRRESRYTKTHGAIRTAQPIASVMPPPTMTTAHTIHAVTVRTAAAMSHLNTLPASRELWELRCELSISSPLHLSCTRRRYLPASPSRPMIIVTWATLRKVADRLQRKTSAQAQTRHRGQRDRTIFPLLNNFGAGSRAMTRPACVTADFSAIEDRAGRKVRDDGNRVAIGRLKRNQRGQVTPSRQ
ncbi:hypothetical protein SMICM17S_04717 [Streptomyces microflavus]